MDRIKIMTKKFNEELGEIKEIDNSLESLQEIVEGYIEIPFINEELMEKNIDLIINEEGKLYDLDVNFLLLHKNKLVNTIEGNVIFASHDSEGKTTSLSEEQIEYIENNILNNKRLVKVLGELKKIPIIEI